MGKNVEFLRGMNLGRRRITNDELCRCFDAMGFADVSAFLASGNVIFSAKPRAGATLATKIAGGLQAQLDREVPTFVRSADEVAAIASYSPFPAAVLARTDGKLQVALLRSEPTAEVARKAKRFATPDDHLAIRGCELHWLPKAGLSSSDLDTRGLERLLGPMTIRTHRTLVRLDAKMSA